MAVAYRVEKRNWTSLMCDQGYVTIFYAHHGPRSLPCVLCGELVEPPWEASDLPRRLRPVVHHKDDDRSHNKIGNLELMHNGCHTSRHLSGKSLSATHRQAISNGGRGRRLSQKTRMKISASLVGRCRSEETRKKLSQAAKRAWHDPEIRPKMLAAAVRGGRTRRKMA